MLAEALAGDRAGGGVGGRRGGARPRPTAQLLRALGHRGVAAGRPGDPGRPGRATATGRPLLGRRPGRRPWPRSTRCAGPSTQEVADVVVDVDGLAPDEVADAGAGRGPRRRRRSRRDADRPGRARRAALRRGGGRRAPATELAEVVAAPVPGAGAGRGRDPGPASASRSTPGVPAEVFTVPDGEEAKSLAVVEELCRGFARSGLSRADVVVAVGGGVVTDLAGFAAAVFHRGTAYVNVATTLLAQVDAAIGGKTGVNLPEGKNLVGAFWQPARRALRHRGARHPPAARVGVGPRRDGQVRLPRRADRPGRAVPLAARPRRSTSRWPGASPSRPPWWRPTSARADRRMLLNYGHTLAHALEAAAFGPERRRDLAPRRGGGRRPGLRRPAGPAPGPDRRRPGRRCTARWSAASTSRRRCPPGPTPSELRRVHGPGQEGPPRPHLRPRRPRRGRVGARRRPRTTWSLPWRRWSIARRATGVSARRLVRAAVRARTSTCWASASPTIYGTATLDDHVAAATGGGRRPRARARAPPDQPRGRPGRGRPRRPGPGRGHHRQRRRAHPHLVVAARRPGRLRRGGGRAPPLQSGRPRAVPPHLGGRPGGRRLHRRLRRSRLPAGRRGRGPAARRPVAAPPVTAPADDRAGARRRCEVAGRLDRLRRAAGRRRAAQTVGGRRPARHRPRPTSAS